MNIDPTLHNKRTWRWPEGWCQGCLNPWAKLALEEKQKGNLSPSLLFFFQNTSDVGFLSVCCEYSKAGNASRNRGEKKAESERCLRSKM